MIIIDVIGVFAASTYSSKGIIPKSDYFQYNLIQYNTYTIYIVYVLSKLKAFQRERLVGPTLHSVLKLEQKFNKKICCENIV